MPAYAYPDYTYVKPPELRGERRRHAVAVVGGGPVGLTLALDLASRGVRSVVLQASHTLSEGSRALCWSQRTLEILDRLGCADEMVVRGFTWSRGRVFHGGAELYAFDLAPQAARKFPAFINLQQYLGEEALVRACERRPDLIELRWRNKAVDVAQEADGVRVRVETPDGGYDLEADWLVACDGARSAMRRALDLAWEGRIFEDHFLIADVDVKQEIPWAERRFWFQPSFHAGETALCHRQADGMWRVDFQLGCDGVDPEIEKRPERALPRIRAMLGADEIECRWLSVYTFQCRRVERFRHGRVFLAGDAAHQVSPFGARGGNSGVQDAENLAWKLALVLRGEAPDALLDTYHDERSYAADENIRITTRTTDFMTARTPLRARLRDAVLGLARRHPFARALINSGRLSTPTIYTESPSITPDEDAWHGGPQPGAPCPDVTFGDGDHLLRRLGVGFQALSFGPAPRDLPPGVEPVEVDDEAVARAFDAAPGTVYLVRPDQHVAARWRRCERGKLAVALDRALARTASSAAKAAE
jgi:3-(3-hydroxy-phenyl)propionate hydroxylase